MVLDDQLRKAIGADGYVVSLSADTYQKQIGNRPENPGHRDIGLQEYRRLPEIAAAPDHVVQDRDQHLVFMKAEGNRYLRAAIKATKSGKGLYLLSLRWAQANEIAALLAKLADLLP